jgi:hypothetical protein
MEYAASWIVEKITRDEAWRIAANIGQATGAAA